MSCLPEELIELIMHFAGAYSFVESERPYIADIQSIGNVVIEQGVKRSLLHLKEIVALRQAYAMYYGNDVLHWMETFHIVSPTM